MSYIVELVGFHTDEILVIDACMNLCGLSMNDAANCVDNMPAPIIKGIELTAANDIKNEFDRMGITVEVIAEEDYNPTEKVTKTRRQQMAPNMQNTGPIPNMQNTGPMPSMQNTGSIPNMQNMNLVSSVQNTGPIPSMQNTGMIPNMQNTGPIPNIQTPVRPMPSMQNTGPLPNMQNTGPIPNMQNTGMIPNMQNTAAIPNMQNTNPLPTLSNTGMMPNMQNGGMGTIQSQMPSMQASYNNDYSNGVAQSSNYAENAQNDYTLQYNNSGFSGFQTEEYDDGRTEQSEQSEQLTSQIQDSSYQADEASEQDTSSTSDSEFDGMERQEAIGNSVVQMSNVEEKKETEDEKEPEYSDFLGGCPRCGSTFVSKKKTTGLFGGGKIKYICDACRYKF